MQNINIPSNDLAKHFQDKYSSIKSAEVSMNRLKTKHEKDGSGLWSVYVRAYNYDMYLKFIDKVVEKGNATFNGIEFEIEDDKQAKDLSDGFAHTLDTALEDANKRGIDIITTDMKLSIGSDGIGSFLSDMQVKESEDA